MAILRRDFLFTFSASILAVFASNRFAFAAEGEAGQISRLSGAITILRDGVEKSATIGEKVLTSDRIQSGNDARAEVTFADGSILTIGPDSEVVISFFAPEAPDSLALLDVIAGIARLTVNKATSWGRFDVRTTTAVASVRGTDYLVENTGLKTAIFVVEGRVAAASRAGSGTVILRQGQGVDVTSEKKPLFVNIWSEERRNELLARVTFP